MQNNTNIWQPTNTTDNKQNEKKLGWHIFMLFMIIHTVPTVIMWSP